ncbi:hypothetical protein BASA50_009723 [Batrachochytrium salamandrivorans]|uniref:C2H2-type domain-containing protein n=1 Tax=Batrachochytrium salamandrivorans TaxID=1357716 RepID=A0ABQ8F3Q4_9FUNG|nr:hypothetical protein BASA50_009723 [Batrachochytrium salamandrivorans]
MSVPYIADQCTSTPISSLQQSSDVPLASHGLSNTKTNTLTDQGNPNDDDDEDDNNDDDDYGESLPARLRPLVFWSRSVFVCPWPGCRPPENRPTKDPMCALDHLQRTHSLYIHNLPHVMPFLDDYIKYWADQVDTHGISILDPFMVGNRYYLGKSTLNGSEQDRDSSVRSTFRQHTLQAVLRIQEQERAHDAHLQRQCLFCKQVPQNRADLFSHMFHEHGFGIGLADNLVYVNEFLDTLHRHLTALECIHCERTFKSNIVLRKHMRKKKHFKINPRNQFYDRYYLINYTEPDAVAYKDEEDESQELNDWEDWNEDGAEEPTMCLFEETVLPSVEATHEHMKIHHGFDLRELAVSQKLSFHDIIRLINYIRSQTFQCACFTCGVSFETTTELETHFIKECHFELPLRSLPFWTNARFLLPFYENDPLLTLDVFEDDMDQSHLDSDSVCQVQPESHEHILCLMAKSAIKDLAIDN